MCYLPRNAFCREGRIKCKHFLEMESPVNENSSDVRVARRCIRCHGNNNHRGVKNEKSTEGDNESQEISNETNSLSSIEVIKNIEKRKKKIDFFNVKIFFHFFKNTNQPLIQTEISR